MRASSTRMSVSEGSVDDEVGVEVAVAVAVELVMEEEEARDDVGTSPNSNFVSARMRPRERA